MEQLKHRTLAKVVAIVNLILSGITLIAIAVISMYLLYLLVFLLPSSNPSRDPELVDEHDRVYAVAVVCGVVLIIGIGLEILEFVSALKLLKSTQPGTNFTEAAKLARFWRNVALFLVALSIIGVLSGGRRSGGTGISGLFYLLLRTLGVLIVHYYIRELEMAASRQQCLVTYAVVGGGGEQGRVINAPSGSVVVVMDPHAQQGFIYPNLSQAETGQGGYPYSDPCPKYADVVGKQ